jgi:hypothetical protein
LDRTARTRDRWWFSAVGTIASELGLSRLAHTDIHFTYPQSGDLHFSLKHVYAERQLERFDNVYFNRIKRKTIDLKDRSRSVSQIVRDHNEDCFTWLMPRYQPPPLANYHSEAIFFQMPVHGIPVNDGHVKIGVSEAESTEPVPSVGRLVIDAGELGTGELNVSAFLLGRGFVSHELPCGSKRFSIIDTSDFPHIELGALFIPRVSAEASNVDA